MEVQAGLGYSYLGWKLQADVRCYAPCKDSRSRLMCGVPV
jgi:hypothetical protein